MFEFFIYPSLSPCSGSERAKRLLLGVHILPARIGGTDAVLGGRVLRNGPSWRADRQLLARHLLPAGAGGATLVRGRLLLQCDGSVGRVGRLSDRCILPSERHVAAKHMFSWAIL